MNNEIEDDKEIADLIKTILEINKQITNPEREKVIELLKKAQNKYPLQSETFENVTAKITKGNIVGIETISTSTLVSKLPYYKSLYIAELYNKCSEKEYNRLKEKYNF